MNRILITRSSLTRSESSVIMHLMCLIDLGKICQRTIEELEVMTRMTTEIMQCFIRADPSRVSDSAQANVVTIDEKSVEISPSYR